MSNRKQENIERINELWRLHRHRDQASETEGRCLAFVIDKRYIEEPEGFELRLGVSFGHNVVTQETRQSTFLPIPVHPGKFVFGLHLVAIKGNGLSFGDAWIEARDAGDSADTVQGEARARAVLDAISDEAYLGHVRSSLEDKRPLKVSSRHLLEDFEVVEGQA